MLRRAQAILRIRSTYIRGLKTPVVGQAQPVTLDLQSIARSRIAEIDSERGVSPFLIDTFNRQHNYLRISLTERCNLRCFYCMPNEGIELSPKETILTDDEIIRLATLFVKSGVTKIRLTGGEPTVRKGLVDIIARLNELRKFGLESIGMTSNGIALHRKLPELVQNGLTHINISLDTLDPFKFEIMTRRMGHEAVLRALDAALTSPQLSVKLNVVVIKGLNDAEVPEFISMTKDKPVSVRFIEFMPFTGNKWDKQKMVPSSELLARISAQYPGVTKAPDELNDTARSYVIPGYRGSFGFISSMSDHFCGSCNRLRVTADGQIKVCLFDPKEISLRDLMRQGASDAELLRTVGLAVGGKQEKHAGMEDIDTVTNRPMILIGDSLPLRSANRAQLQLKHRIPSFLYPSTPTIPITTQYRLYSSHAPSSAPVSPKLTHIDESGRPSMVDVSSKDPTKRTAVATGRIYIPQIAYDLITTRDAPSPGSSPSSSLEKAKAKARSKGDVLTVAQLAAIMGCKRTSDLIPLCHPLQLSHISVQLFPEVHHPIELSASTPPSHSGAQSPSNSDSTAAAPSLFSVRCVATVTCEGKTGVEMEALTAVSVGLLTVWDMLKAVAGKEMTIGEIVVSEKYGGKSGDFIRS